MRRNAAEHRSTPKPRGSFTLWLRVIFEWRDSVLECASALALWIRLHRPRKTSLVCLALWSTVVAANAQVNVTQEHNHLSRNGLYIDSAFTPVNAANLMRDLGFDGTISGNVYALDANDGSII